MLFIIKNSINKKKQNSNTLNQYSKTNITALKRKGGKYVESQLNCVSVCHDRPFKGNSVKHSDTVSSLKREKAVGKGSKSLRYVITLAKVLKVHFKVNCLGEAGADLFDLRYTFLCVSLWMKFSYTDLEVVKYK